MSCWTKEELEEMLFDVVNELDLSDTMIHEHGQHGTAPAKLVRLVLDQKNREIQMLKQGFVPLARRVMRRGAGDRTPLDYNQDVISWRDCPDCGGRGWFLIQPFKTGGENGCGGISNTCQCMTCVDVSMFYEKHGFMPELIKPHNVELRGAHK